MSLTNKFMEIAAGALGAATVLIVLPSAALFLGMPLIDKHPTVGLPLLAVFGVMILFGSMSLTATLFQRLGLASSAEALGLPPGSVRAAIALALLVLFAIFVILVFRSLAEPVRLSGLGEQERNAMLREQAGRVVAVFETECKPAAAAHAPASAPSAPADASSAPATRASCFELHLTATPGKDAVDVAKQMLTLIGTLLTSVVSYYFAARTAADPKETAARAARDAETKPADARTAQAANKAADQNRPGEQPAQRASGPVAAAGTVTAASLTADAPDELGSDGCCAGEGEAGSTAPITADEELPPAKGGVA